MQLISWTIARLGSRFALHFEPYRRRVMHSALGRFLDEPLDLAAGLIGPDGIERTLPFTTRGEQFYYSEQFERPNSITFRAYSRDYHLRFELNVHSVFYPRNDRLCTLPVFYLEMRVNPAERVRWSTAKGEAPEKVTLLLKLRRPDTTITVRDEPRGEISLSYENRLTPRLDDPTMGGFRAEDDGRRVHVDERIVSLNPDARVSPDGEGLLLDLPVSEIGSGKKWRLVWGAYCGEPVLTHHEAGDDEPVPMKLRYTCKWRHLDAVIDEAITRRDDHLAHSRLFEKLVEQAPLGPAKSHLLNQSFQSFLSNTFWCNMETQGGDEPWFSTWEGSALLHSTLDVEYNIALFYLSLWPELLALLVDEWGKCTSVHQASGGRILDHDMGRAMQIRRGCFDHPMPVEENSNFLLILQAYAHWTGDLSPVKRHADLIGQLADYLLWTDRDHSGFPSEGTANTIGDASPVTQYARKQTYLAVKRLAALSAASDLLVHVGRPEDSDRAAAYERLVLRDVPRVEHTAWMGDHYAICVDPSTAGLTDAWTRKPLLETELDGWDGYSIYTANGLLLPAMCGQPLLFDRDDLVRDMYSAFRETLGPYGCAHSTNDRDNVWVSQNLWRDHMARYLGETGSGKAHRYWDLQVASNTGAQSMGYTDTYIGNYLCFYPRGVAAIGFLVSYPRLSIDRLAPGGARISVDPDRDSPQRWPLLPLIDWDAGKIPVCVVDEDGIVHIESTIEQITVRGDKTRPSLNMSDTIG